MCQLFNPLEALKYHMCPVGRKTGILISLEDRIKYITHRKDGSPGIFSGDKTLCSKYLVLKVKITCKWEILE